MTAAKRRGGRQKGTPNKDKQEILDLILESGCDHPLQGLGKIAYIAFRDGDYQLSATCYKELAQYVAPKRKAIEHSGEVKGAEPLVVVVPETGE